KYYDGQFLFKLVNGYIDYAYTLRIEFSVPRGTSSKALFARGFQARHYSFLSRLLKSGGEASDHIDSLGTSTTTFQ
ncbi:hypothetical protein J6590_093428, partial [Homalodisca vitripennis]